MPMRGSDPTLGEVGQLEFVDEDRIELVVIDKGGHEQVKETIKELKNVRCFVCGFYAWKGFVDCLP